MRALYALIAVAILLGVVYVGAGPVGLTFVFGVLLPYVAIALFLVGLVYRVFLWAKAPVPSRRLKSLTEATARSSETRAVTVTVSPARLGLGYPVSIAQAVTCVPPSSRLTETVRLRAPSLPLSSVALIWYHAVSAPAGMALSTNSLAVTKSEASRKPRIACRKVI